LTAPNPTNSAHLSGWRTLAWLSGGIGENPADRFFIDICALQVSSISQLALLRVSVFIPLKPTSSSRRVPVEEVSEPLDQRMGSDLRSPRDLEERSSAMERPYAFL
jgi:hypothetical protein